MHIDLESPERLKIELSGEDLKKLNMTYEQLDYNDERTRRVLSGLLKFIGAPMGFKNTDGRLMIEVFPAPGQGCVIYFTALLAKAAPNTRLRLKRFRTEPYVFEFLCSSDMLEAVSQLKSVPKSAFSENELYLYDNRYRLIIYPLAQSDSVTHMLGEFGQLAGSGQAAAAYTSEHGRLICTDAVKNIGGFLS